VDGKARWDGSIALHAQSKSLKNDVFEVKGDVVVGQDAYLVVLWFPDEDGTGVNVNDKWHLVKTTSLSASPKFDKRTGPNTELAMVDNKLIDMTLVE
jgi:hypothetical protein